MQDRIPFLFTNHTSKVLKFSQSLKNYWFKQLLQTLPD